jgi:hypothetical protein
LLIQEFIDCLFEDDPPLDNVSSVPVAHKKIPGSMAGASVNKYDSGPSGFHQGFGAQDFKGASQKRPRDSPGLTFPSVRRKDDSSQSSQDEVSFSPSVLLKLFLRVKPSFSGMLQGYCFHPCRLMRTTTKTKEKALAAIYCG